MYNKRNELFPLENLHVKSGRRNRSYSDVGLTQEFPKTEEKINKQITKNPIKIEQF